MTDFLDLPTLIIIGIAIAVFWRLRSVLGTRTGNERPPAETVRPRTEKREDDDTVVPLRPQPANGDENSARQWRKIEAEIEQFSKGDEALAKGLKAIAEADSGFTPKSFIEGAKAAYEMIVTAFAEGDRKTLKSLLEKDVYEGFEGAISAREAEGHTVDFTFVGLPGVDIVEAELDKKTAKITMRYKAELVSATRDKSGDVIEGDAEQVAIIKDEWTFARATKSRDPNWKLIATEQLD